MGLIKGIPVTLYDKAQTGEDAFGAPVYEESGIVVDNVLVAPVTAEEVHAGQMLYGKHVVYELYIPKGDSHTWEDRRVSFYGETFRAFGFTRELMEGLVPLDWNARVKVERYG